MADEVQISEKNYMHYIYIYIYNVCHIYTVNCGVQIDLVYLAQNSGLDLYLQYRSTPKHIIGDWLDKTYPVVQNEDRLR